MFNALTSAGLFLAKIDPSNVSTGLESNAAFKAVQGLFYLVGVVVVIMAVVKVISHALNGKGGPAAKAGVLGLVLGALCFKLTLPFTLIGGVGSFISNIFTSIGDQIN